LLLRLLRLLLLLLLQLQLLLQLLLMRGNRLKHWLLQLLLHLQSLHWHASVIAT